MSIVELKLNQEIAEYSTKKIPFTLFANYLGEYEQHVRMIIRYKGKTDQINLIIKFTISDIPLFPDKQIFDLNYLINNEIFREKLIFTNISNISYKIQITFPKELERFLEVNPNLGYIQANSDFEVWLKFKPDSEFIYKLHRFFRSEEGFVFPLRFSFSNIKLPTIVLFYFCLTQKTVKVSKSFIEFNTLYSDESCSLPLIVENESRLVQKVGFIMCPKEISVSPNICTILPGEKFLFTVCYTVYDNYTGHRENEFVNF